MKVLGTIFLALIIIPLVLLYEASFYCYVYNWFIPQIYDLPMISTKQMVGLLMVKFMLLFRLKDLQNFKEDRPLKESLNIVLAWLIGPPLILLIAFVIKSIF